MNRDITHYFLPETPRSGKRKERSQSSPDLIGESFKKALLESDNKVNKEMSLKNLSSEDFFRQLDKRLEKLATKTDLAELHISIGKLTTDNENMKTEMAAVKRREAEILKMMDDLENRSRRNNLVFRGIRNSGSTDFENLVKSFCVSVLGCGEDIVINRAHTLNIRTKDGNLPIIAHIPRDKDIHAIFQNVKKLRGTGFVIQRDYSRTVRGKRYKLLQIKKKVDEISKKTLRTNLVFDHLYIDGKRFDWTSENKLICGDKDGNIVLRECLGQDFGQLIESLVEKKTSQPVSGPSSKNM